MLVGRPTLVGPSIIARPFILGTLLRYLVSAPEVDYARLPGYPGYSGSLAHVD